MLDLGGFENLSFEKFKERAKNPVLRDFEKVGFPAEYRLGKEKDILESIFSKLSRPHHLNKRLLDLGCGCSGLTRLMIAESLRRGYQPSLIDSHEMLTALGVVSQGVDLLAGRFPVEFRTWILANESSFDTIIAYSVFQYVRAEGLAEDFLSSCISLLKPGGELFLGDLPNFSLKIEFLSSEKGRSYHQNHFGDFRLDLAKLKPEEGSLDHQAMANLKSWLEKRGLNVLIFHQPEELPFANRRQDLLARKKIK